MNQTANQEKVKMQYIPLDRNKSRAQRQADEFLSTGDWVLSRYVANKLNVTLKKAKDIMGNPDRICGKAHPQIYLYRKERADSVIEKYGN